MAADELRRMRAGAPEFLAEARRRLLAARGNGDAAKQTGHLVVCGDDPLAHRLIHELAVGYRQPVTVVLRSKRRNHGPEIAKLADRRDLRIHVVEAEHLDEDAFHRAGVPRAAALALVQQDDVGNLHAALRAQELNPDLRLIIRMFNMSLGHGIRVLVRHCQVLSDASIAAPAFVASALGGVSPSYVRLPGRTLYVARRTDVPPAKVLCGLADTTGGAPVLLPPDQERCDLVLAVADGVVRATTEDEGPSLPVSRRRAGLLTWWHQLAAGRLFGSVLNRTLRIAALALLGVLLLGTGLLAALSGHLSIWEAFYVTVLNTVGGANPDPTASGAEQVIQVVVMLAGIAMVPVVTAAVVEAVINARLALALGKLRGPVADHVVVVGLGNVGTRVIQQLRDLGVPVVAIDRTDEARGAQLARELGVPLIIGDASRPETLSEASVQTARSLVVLSTDDVVNLEAALNARALKPDLRVVLRLFDGDFADRVQRAFDITSSKSVSYLAAPAFTAAVLEHEVIGTIPVKRNVLLVAEVPVEPGSALADGTVATAARNGELRVIARTTGGYRDAQWAPPPDRPLQAGERLVVVATRAGLGRLTEQAAPPAPPVVQEDSSSTA